MRRLLAILTVLVACLFGLPATAQAAQAAPMPIGGGSVLSTLGGARCTAGFAATNANAGYLIAGPGCPSGDLYIGGVLVGPSTASPGYSVVQVTNTAAWTLVPWVDGTVTIGGSMPAPVGGSVCLVDTRTGIRCGTVTALNQTVNFPQGVLTGLTRTNICLEPGGAVAYLSGDQAQGVPVGGSGSCSSGGVSYFQPVNPILAAYGLTLLTG